jgi:amino acid adenylation domain-containing protein
LNTWRFFILLITVSQYDIAVSIDIVNEQFEFGFLYWSPSADAEIRHLADAFRTSLDCFLNHADQSVESLSLLSETEVTALHSDNKDILDSTVTTVLQAIEMQIQLRLDDVAIASWDDEFSYRQMDNLTRGVAAKLHKHAVGRGDHIVTCLNKSAWSIVIILAIVRAGAVFVAANPAHPTKRTEFLVKSCNAKLIITEPQDAYRFNNTQASSISIERDVVEPFPPGFAFPLLQGHDMATIIYTSGSTGEPKGILVDHRSLSTSALVGHGKTLGFYQETRTLQFSTFTFDVALADIFTTLSHGGCVCVPSEDERMSTLAACINRLKANLVITTPTVLRTLQPKEVPHLQTVAIGGEPLSQQDLETWADYVHLYNVYGPSEALVCVSINGPLRRNDDPSNIGHALTGTRLWVAEIESCNRLAPVGCIGEVVIESAQVSRGYHDNPARTAAAFVEPLWLREIKKHENVYRTGDLARYNSDGTLRYIGRKDKQVKIRGQRVELGEVEHYVQQHFPGAQTVVAEMVTPVGYDRSILAVFVHSGTDIEFHEDQPTVETVVSMVISKSVIQELEDQLPCYMVPSIFFSILTLPVSVTGKTDRIALRQIGSTFSIQQLAISQNEKRQKGRDPSTEIELELQNLWAATLKVSPDTISLDTNFFRLGGDSVAAMKLVVAARNSGITFTVADVFRNPHIEDLARKASPSPRSPSPGPEAPMAFSHVAPEKIAGIVSQVPTSFAPDMSIEDILPATDMQTYYVELTVHDSRDALHYFYLDFDSTLEASRLSQSCQAIVEEFPILRTIFVTSFGQIWQIILRRLKVSFQLFDNVDDLHEASRSFCLDDMNKHMEAGYPFLSFAFFQHTGRKMSRLVIRISHAQFDGMSLPILLDSLKNAYMGIPTSATTRFSSFVSHSIQKRAELVRYWSRILHGAEMTCVSDVLSKQSIRTPSPKSSLTYVAKTIPIPSPPAGVTVASLVSAAWSIVLNRLTGKDDVVYGFVVSGRNTAQLPCVHTVVGPCVNTIPIRVRFSSDLPTTEHLLRHVMDQHLSNGDADTLGYRDIVKNCTTWPRETKVIDSLVQFHDLDEHPTVQLVDGMQQPTVGRLDWFPKPYPVPSKIEVSARPQGERLQLAVSAANILDTKTAQAVLGLFGEVVGGLWGESRTLSSWLDSLDSPFVTCSSMDSVSPMNTRDMCVASALTIQLFCHMLLGPGSRMLQPKREYEPQRGTDWGTVPFKQQGVEITASASST